MNVLKTNRKIDIPRLITTIAIPVIGGALSGILANRNTRETYSMLETPDFAPPGWIFPIVWTILYVMMGIAKYLVDTHATSEKERLGAAIPYYIQLGLNFLWSFLFFKWALRGVAFFEIIILLIMIIYTTYKFYKINRTAGYLMIPYILWVAFASILNFSIWQLNL